MNVVIIGCGLIGRKRALALDPEDKLAACCDTNLEIAGAFGKEFSCLAFSDHKILLNEIQFDAVVVAVINKYIKEIVIDAIRLSKNVIAEKPLGRNAAEAREIINAMEGWKNGRMEKISNPLFHNSNIPVLKTGFNHRFHPAIWRAKKMVDSGEIGKPLNIRARYGHGGRPGMEKEWRSSKDLCGGGEMLDQGVHIIDLIRWFGGEIKEVIGKVETKFWPLEVEDNAMAILKTEKDVSASLHVSWTNWKNIFSFEIFGTGGYLRIEGLGGSYGQETLEFGKRKPEGGKPDVQLFEFPTEDVSWKNEWKEFKTSIMEKRDVIGDGYDGLKANEIVEAIYRSSKELRVIKVGK
jgi:predicted dehydrogenase